MHGVLTAAGIDLRSPLLSKRQAEVLAPPWLGRIYITCFRKPEEHRLRSKSATVQLSDVASVPALCLLSASCFRQLRKQVVWRTKRATNGLNG